MAFPKLNGDLSCHASQCSFTHMHCLPAQVLAGKPATPFTAGPCCSSLPLTVDAGAVAGANICCLVVDISCRHRNHGWVCRNHVVARGCTWREKTPLGAQLAIDACRRSLAAMHQLNLKHPDPTEEKRRAAKWNHYHGAGWAVEPSKQAACPHFLCARYYRIYVHTAPGPYHSSHATQFSQHWQSCCRNI